MNRLSYRCSSNFNFNGYDSFGELITLENIEITTYHDAELSIELEDIIFLFIQFY